MVSLNEVIEQAGASPDNAVFVSRSGADRELAIWIGECLQRIGLVAILQDWHFNGVDYMIAMDRVLRTGARVLVLLSRDYENSEHCMKEATTPLSSDQMNSSGRVVVLRIENFVPAGIFRNISYVDFHQAIDAWDEELMQELLSNALKVSPRPIVGGDGRRGAAPFSQNSSVADEIASVWQDCDMGSPTFRQFLLRINLANVKKISVFATVGGVTVRQLRTVLKDRAEAVGNRAIDVQVLLSSSAQSSATRARGVGDTIDQLKRFSSEVPCFRVTVRSYASPPVFRGAVVDHTDGTRSGYVAFYYWGSSNVLANSSEADGNGIEVLPTDGGHPLITLFSSWFDHFWGTANINTILLDFDDTIFDTTDAQVGGWVSAINFVLAEGDLDAGAFNEPLKQAIQAGSDLTPVIREIFLIEQNAERIFQRIMKVVPTRIVRQSMHQHRVDERKRLTIQSSEPIEFVLDDLRKLHRRYRLIIVSATFEDIIKETLGRPGRQLNHLFSYIFGRSADEFDTKWDGVESKAQRFLRISAMLGVPLDRMVFVGDSDSDCRAARQLGMHFIENKYNALKHGRNSLLGSENQGHRHLTGRQPGELIERINDIEEEFRRT